MRRRGQVFLIITVLVVTFLIGISTLLLDTQRAAYLETAPDSNTVLQAWDNTYDSIVQILRTQLSISSNGPDLSVTTDLTTELLYLENYLLDRGLSAIIRNTSTIDFNSIDSRLSFENAELIASLAVTDLCL